MAWDSRDPASLSWRTRTDDMPMTQNTLQAADYPYFAELAHFLDCLDKGCEFRVTPHDALMAVKVSQAALHSIRTGQPVSIADFRE